MSGRYIVEGTFIVFLLHYRLTTAVSELLPSHSLFYILPAADTTFFLIAVYRSKS
jgi:hypothetical protein